MNGSNESTLCTILITEANIGYSFLLFEKKLWPQKQLQILIVTNVFYRHLTTQFHMVKSHVSFILVDCNFSNKINKDFLKIRLFLK